MSEFVVPPPEQTAVVKSFGEAIIKNIGQPIRRKEDKRLLTGAGQFTDDFTLPIKALPRWPARPIRTL